MSAAGMWILLSAATWLAPAFAEPPPTDLYTDATFGFSLRIPRDWRVDRCRKPDHTGVVVLQLYKEVSPKQIYDISIRTSQTKEAKPVATILTEIVDELKKNLKDFKVIRQDKRDVNKRHVVDLSATCSVDEEERYIMVRMIQAWPQQYYVILFNGPRGSALDIEPLFRSTADSFRVLEDPASDHVIREALSAGRNWFSEITQKTLADLVDNEWCVVMYDGGQPIGFLQSSTMDFEYAGRHGLGLLESGWTFLSDGTARYVHNELWLRYDGRAERWQCAAKTLIPAAGDRPAAVDAFVEDGSREDDKLITSQTIGYGQPAENNPTFTLPPSYLPRLAGRLFPRIVGDLVSPRLLAFNEYDTERRGLILRTFELKGALESGGGKSAEQVFRIREREGLATDLADTYVDKFGRLIRSSAGRYTLKPTRPDAARQLFASKVDAAEKKVRELEAEYAEGAGRFFHDDPPTPKSTSPKPTSPKPSAPPGRR